MKKRHGTVLQNAWSQKNKHFHWKNNSGLQNPEAKKTNTFIGKTILALKTL